MPEVTTIDTLTAKWFIKYKQNYKTAKYRLKFFDKNNKSQNISTEYLNSSDIEIFNTIIKKKYPNIIIQTVIEETPQQIDIIHYKYNDPNIWKLTYSEYNEEYWYCNNRTAWFPPPPPPPLSLIPMS